DLTKALADFEKAGSDKAPDWVQYQAHYQTVVANLRAAMAPEAPAKAWSTAQGSFDAFKKWIPKDNVDAQLSADLLGFRLLWMQAEAKADATERHQAERAAMDKLNTIISRDARFRDLVYQ